MVMKHTHDGDNDNVIHVSIFERLYNKWQRAMHALFRFACFCASLLASFF